jgi:CheY-like chemotaxis protein
MGSFDQQQPKPGSGRILVYDEDQDTSVVLAELLTDEGFLVRATSRLDAALAALEAEAFSLVIGDYPTGLPESAARQARALLDAALPAPVGIVTAWAVPESLSRACAFVLTKPFDLEELLGTVGRFTVSQQGSAALLESIQKYFRALSTRDWNVLGALCTASVKYQVPGRHAFSRTIVGRGAFVEYAAQVFGPSHDAKFELLDVSWMPRGAVARYAHRWNGATGEQLRDEGAVLFAFEGNAISQVGVRFDAKRAEKFTGVGLPVAAPH